MESLVETAEREAMAELAEEDRRTAIDKAKDRIRERRMRPLWHKIFPFTITITWR